MPALPRKPPWLRRRLPSPGRSGSVAGLLSDLDLYTVCQEAHCPNQGQCYGAGTATFLLLGPDCTRNCTFCAVGSRPPDPPDPEEPERIAQAVKRLGLEFCVLTMVTRDDLPDGGAGHIARTMESIRRQCPGLSLEVLISDLKGSRDALETVLAAEPEVMNHNLETVPRLYSSVRPQADYWQSLKLLARAAGHQPRPAIKSGLMLGLGETKEEILQVFTDLRDAGCDLITLGQYLAPSARHYPVVRFVHPDEFDELAAEAEKSGFTGCAAGPYVRSSYRAAELYQQTGAGQT